MSRLLVRLSEQKLQDYKWLLPLENIINVLPHGSGFDGKWEIDFDSDEEKIILSNSYHAMDGNGMYSGWLNFNIFIARPDRCDEDGILNDPYQWYHTFEIEYDDADLDYDDGSEEYEFEDDDFDEDGNLTEDAIERQEEWRDMENPAVSKELLIEYIDQTISESLQGIVSAVIFESEE